MKLNKFHLKNFRNHKDITLEFSPYLNIIKGLEGGNLRGKTNIFRSLYKLTYFDTIDFDEDLTWGSDANEIKLSLETTDYTLTRFVSRSTQKFRFVADGETTEVVGITAARNVIKPKVGFREFSLFKGLTTLNFFTARQNLLLSQNTSMELYKLFSSLYGISYFTDNLKLVTKNQKARLSELQAKRTQREELNASFTNTKLHQTKLELEIDKTEDKIKAIEAFELELQNKGADLAIIDELVNNIKSLLLLTTEAEKDIAQLVDTLKLLGYQNVTPVPKQLTTSSFETNTCPTCNRPL